MTCYCVNPRCTQRLNEDTNETCSACGTLLTVRDRYRLITSLKPLSDDSPSEVFSINDRRQPERPQVIKVLHQTGELEDNKRRELHQREAGVLINFAHPGIPNAEFDGYFEIHTATGESLYCLVMDKVEGDNLIDWLEANGPISSAQALDWLQQLTSILHVLHSNWVFHRDIKPDNIILQPSGQLVIIDFGAVREVTHAYVMQMSADPSSLGSEGKAFETTRIYTYGYAGPEQVNGRAIPQSDFFSLGRTLIHLATATQPKYLPVDHQTNRLQWRDKAPQLSEDLADYIDRLVEDDPRNRPQSTSDILNDLEGRLSHSPRVLRRGRWLQSPWIMIALVFGAVAILVGGYYYRYYYDRRIEANRQFAIASQLVVEGDLEAARKRYEKSIELAPSSRTYNYLANTCAQLKDTDCAIQAYRASIEADPDAWESYTGLGDVYDELQNYSEASNAYRTAIKLNPENAVVAYNNLARLHIIQGNFQEAINNAKQGLANIEGNEGKAALLKNLGWAEYKRGNLQDAKTALLESASLDPNLAATQCLLAQVAEALGEPIGEYRQQCINLSYKGGNPIASQPKKLRLKINFSQ